MSPFFKYVLKKCQKLLIIYQIINLLPKIAYILSLLLQTTSNQKSLLVDTSTKMYSWLLDLDFIMYYFKA